MMQKVINQRTSQPNKENSQKLFSGLWIRWSVLTGAERLICANIVLLPVWWLVGISAHMLLFLLLGIIWQDWRRYGELPLKKPSWMVIALFAYSIYEYVDVVLVYFNAYPSIELPSDYVQSAGNLFKSTLHFLVVPTLVWYIQSNKVKIRLEPIAWACSISVVQMLLLWGIFQIFPLSFETPPRTLYAFLTGKTPNYTPTPGLGISPGNYLLVIDEGRFRFFFDHYQTAAVFLGFIGLLALDLKNRLWSVLLLVACCFLLATTGARAIWIALPPVLFLRFLYIYGKATGGWLFFGLFALISFLTLSVPPVTNYTFNLFQETQQGVSEARPGSSEARSKVYQETIKRIPDKIIFGHKVEGEKATGGPSAYLWAGDGAPIGSHSFILGTLLYQKGIVGTSLFAAFWILLWVWLYQTRLSRPSCCFLLPLMLTITSIVSIIHTTMTTTTLMCMMLHKPAHSFIDDSHARRCTLCGDSSFTDNCVR